MGETSEMSDFEATDKAIAQAEEHERDAYTRSDPPPESAVQIRTLATILRTNPRCRAIYDELVEFGDMGDGRDCGTDFELVSRWVMAAAATATMYRENFSTLARSVAALANGVRRDMLDKAYSASIADAARESVAAGIEVAPAAQDKVVFRDDAAYAPKLACAILHAMELYDWRNPDGFRSGRAGRDGASQIAAAHRCLTGAPAELFETIVRDALIAAKP